MQKTSEQEMDTHKYQNTDSSLNSTGDFHPPRRIRSGRGSKRMSKARAHSISEALYQESNARKERSRSRQRARKQSEKQKMKEQRANNKNSAKILIKKFL